MCLISNTDIFTSALDFPVCLSPNDTYSDMDYYRHWKWRQSQFFEEKIFYGAFGNKKLENYVDYYDMPPYKCLQDWTTDYLNRMDVKQALHAKDNITWGACNWSKTMEYNNTDTQQPMQPVIEYLVNGEYGLKITIYSGDDDTVCAFFMPHNSLQVLTNYLSDN